MRNYEKYKNSKIEMSYFSHCDDWWRTFYWRVDPKELSFWDRIFMRNPWTEFEQANGDDLINLYTVKEYKEQLENIKTYEDAVNYQREQDEMVYNENDDLTWGF